MCKLEIVSCTCGHEQSALHTCELLRRRKIGPAQCPRYRVRYTDWNGWCDECLEEWRKYRESERDVSRERRIVEERADM